MSASIEYRVVWKRDGVRRKVKRFQGRPSAERFVGLLTSDEPWLFMREQPAPDDYVCCDGRECGCEGQTIREHCEALAAKLPPLEYVRIESREVEPWVSTEQPDRGGRRG